MCAQCKAYDTEHGTTGGRTTTEQLRDVLRILTRDQGLQRAADTAQRTGQLRRAVRDGA